MIFRQEIRVTPIRGELKRFFVDSERPGQHPYLVDLDSYDGNGECACDNFRIRLVSKVQTEARKPKNQRWPMRCKHIKWAREYLLDKLLAALRSPAHTAKFNREN